MIKRTYLLIGIFMLFVLAACGGTEDAATAVNQPANTSDTAAMVDNDMAMDDTEKMDDASMDDMHEGEESMDDASMDDTAMDDMHEGEENMEDADMSHDDTAMADTEETMDDASMDDMHEGEESMDDADMSHDDMAMDDTMVAMAAWQKLPLVNARTGETFTLADFAGKAVFVETMATWCSNCRQQLTNVREAIGQVDSEQAVFIALSVETNIDAATLADYADNEGFDWLFAVATPELLTELAGQFGQSITNPPSTPHFVIHPDGSTTELETGIDSAADVAAQVQATLMQ
ncbi:MAG: redoxin domain-containing protein [Ardenticatenaceae bacterium]|nr:redoxin domain-containing protein [Ardenticatenaceae bacterium]